MPTQTRDVSPGPHPRQVKAANGQLLDVPSGWSLLPPGDAALSRRVKSEGPCWCVKEKRGRKIFSQGIWAPHERIERIRAELAVERQQPDYQRKLDAGRERRAKVIHAEGELQASEKLLEAAEALSRRGEAMQLRYLQTLTQIANDRVSTIVFPVPVDILGRLFEGRQSRPDEERRLRERRAA